MHSGNPNQLTTLKLKNTNPFTQDDSIYIERKKVNRASYQPHITGASID